MLRAAEEEVWNYKRSEADADVLFIHAAQTNSLSFSMLHSTHFIFLEHISGKSVLGNGEPGFYLPGTRWDCVITVGRWSPPRPSPTPPTHHPTSYWDSESKDIGVSILSWKQTSNVTVWKQDDDSVSQKSAPLCNISEYYVQTVENMYFMCDVIAQYIFLSLPLVLLFMR